MCIQLNKIIDQDIDRMDGTSGEINTYAWNYNK